MRFSVTFKHTMHTMEPNSETFVCFKCKHFQPFKGGCAAFPDGIPSEITPGENEHTTPLPGQENNLVFEPGTPDELAVKV